MGLEDTSCSSVQFCYGFYSWISFLVSTTLQSLVSYDEVPECILEVETGVGGQIYFQDVNIIVNKDRKWSMANLSKGYESKNKGGMSIGSDSEERGMMKDNTERLMIYLKWVLQSFTAA